MPNRKRTTEGGAWPTWLVILDVARPQRSNRQHMDALANSLSPSAQERSRSDVCALVNARRFASRSSSESGAEARGGPRAAWRAKRAQAAGLTLLPSTTRAVAASARPAAEQGTPGGAREASGSE